MPDFAELEQIFLEVRKLANLPTNDFSWSSWMDTDAALAEIDSIIARLRQEHLPATAEILFLPTGPLQELAMCSGWGDEFIELANRFDDVKK